MPLLARSETSFHVPIRSLQCPGNVDAELTGWQPPVDAVSPAIFTFRCNSSATAGGITTSAHTPFITTPPFTRFMDSTLSPVLEKRQAPTPPNICVAQCATSCYTSGIQYNADECGSLSNWMFQRGAQFEVRPHERVVMTWGSCMYTFTNDRRDPVTWCDTQWAQIGVYIAGPCQSPNTGGGGQCAGDGFLVEVLSNDGSTDTPTPYSSTITANITTSSGSITTTSTPMATAEIYTQVPIPPMTTVSTILPSNNVTLSTTKNDDSNTTFPMVPLVVGIIGGLLFLIFAIVGFVMVWRRSHRGPRLRLPSEDGHATRVDSTYNLKLTKMAPSQDSISNRSQPQKSNQRVQFQRSNTDDQSLQVPKAAAATTPPKDDSSQGTPTPSRVPTSLSMYTIDFDPFRALRRNRSLTENGRNAAT